MNATERIRNLFGNGHSRDPDDVAQALADDPEVLHKALQRMPGVPQPSSGNEDPMIANPWADEDYVSKQSQFERARHKSEYPWLYDPTRGVRWDFDPIQLRNLAQENTWVGMLVQTISKEIAQTSWTVAYDDEDDTETEKRLSKSPFERGQIEKQAEDVKAERIRDLLHNPNPDHTWTDLAEMAMADLLEIGSVTWIKAFPERAYGGPEGMELVDENARPLALKPSAPEVWTKAYTKKTGILEGYWQFDKERSPGGNRNLTQRGIQDPIHFDSAEVVWDDMSPRSNRRYGMPPTLLVRDFLKLLDLTVTQEQQYFSKGSIPSGAWVFEEWDREQVKEWKSENEENIKGKPHKSLMFAGMGGNVKFEPMSFNWNELQFLERVQWYARVIASAFQVPTAVVGLQPEKINYHTFQGERGNFEENTLGPYLQKLERTVNNQLIWPHWGRNYRFEFTPGVSETTRKSISERVRSEFNAGIITRNEARRKVGYDPVDETEDGFQSDVAPDAGGQIDPTELVETADGREVKVPTTEALERHQHEHTAKADEPLRNTENWDQFSLQPNDIEPLAEAIEGDISQVFEAVLSDADIESLIEQFAEDEETEKSLTNIERELKEIIQNNDLISGIRNAIEEYRESRIAEAVDQAVSDVDADVDPGQVMRRVQNRDIKFVDAFAERMSSEIRETVAEGWNEGKNSLEIADDLEAKADQFEGWEAERIARQELQIATGEARNEFARQAGKLEIWQTAQDDRVRDAHAQMQGKWKRPAEDWEVDYSDRGRGVQKEEVPGDSEPGIGCRCTTLLRDIDEVDPEDHAGVT